MRENEQAQRPEVGPVAGQGAIEPWEIKWKSTYYISEARRIQWSCSKR